MNQTTLGPRILVTVGEEVVGRRWSDYSADYARAVESAGGQPIPLYYERYAADAVPTHDGILTIGGIDVDPSQYGDAPRAAPRGDSIRARRGRDRAHAPGTHRAQPVARDLSRCRC